MQNMEANVLRQNRISTLTSAHWKVMIKHKPSVVAVLRRTSDDIIAERTKTNDNWFDRLAINHLSKSVQAATGLSNSKSGYESLVEATIMAKQKFNPIQQREVVIQALHRAFPKPILSLIKALLPPSRFAREHFAAFTTLFFAWLVGPSEVNN
ncbi:putative beta-carotene isomerase D27, chloroplastic [Sesbania bispinosa]|nr:putative beta-carotene isomerase D27, chloroplastic [Sesbania bispinosa]